MMCYRDRTYCARALEDCSCPEDRKITPEVMKAAIEWHGGEDPPFCVAELCKGKIVFLDRNKNSQAVKDAVARADERNW